MKEDPPVLLRILVLLDAGNYPAKITRTLGFSKQKVYYWIKKALAGGLIERKSRDVITLYRLTPKGEEWSKEFLDGVERRSLRVVRLHNVVLKYPISKQPDIEIDWRRVELQNWSQLIGRESGLTVRRSPDSVEIFCDTIRGDDPPELMLMALQEANRLAERLEQKFMMRLGIPQLSRKPHYAVQDPVARIVGSAMEFSDDIVKLDESEGEGELDLYDPNFVKDYLVTFTLLPRVVAKYGLQIRKIKEILDGYGGALKAFEKTICEHLKLIQEYLEEAVTRREENKRMTNELIQYLHRPGLLSRLKNWLARAQARA